MTTIDVLIPYREPTLAESLKAELVLGDMWELREHAGFAPLAPGDKVRINASNELTAIVSLERAWVYDVQCHLPTGIDKVQDLFAEWRQDTWVTEMTGFTCRLSATPDWFDLKVVRHDFVEFTELIRTPNTQLTLGELLDNPTFGGNP